MNKLPKYLVLSFLLILVQVTVLKLISIESIVPDVLSVWIVYLAFRQGQLAATVWGFGIGLTVDFMTGNFIGLAALTKTLCGFVAGYFFMRTKLRS